MRPSGWGQRCMWSLLWCRAVDRSSRRPCYGGVSCWGPAVSPVLMWEVAALQRRAWRVNVCQRCWCGSERHAFFLWVQPLWAQAGTEVCVSTCSPACRFSTARASSRQESWNEICPRQVTGLFVRGLIPMFLQAPNTRSWRQAGKTGTSLGVRLWERAGRDGGQVCMRLKLASGVAVQGL